MRFFEFKTPRKTMLEAKGMFGRLAGDPYKNANGKTAELVQVVAFPDATQGQFEDAKARDEAIKQFEEEHKMEMHGAKIEWVNQPNAGTLAFGIAQLQDSDGQHIYWGRYLRQVGADLMGVWDNKQIPAGWALMTKSSQKLNIGLDPQTLIRSDRRFKGSEDIIRTVESNLPDEYKNVLTEALKDSAQGKLAEFPGQWDKQEAIRDYFGEIMGPIAMIGGAVKGQADDALNQLADGQNWRDMEVFWPMSKNYNLVDSVFIAGNGQKIGISSKGGQGASASAKNIYDAAVKAEKEGNTELLEESKFTVEIVEAISKYQATVAPFVLGKRFKLIDDATEEEIKGYMKAGKRDLEGISSKCEKLLEPFNVQLETVGFNAGYALVSALAKLIAKEVNANPEFSKGAIALLNQSSIIQLYTKLGKRGEDAVVNSFEAVYPPNFQGSIELDGSKNYYSSRIGGKFSFKFKK